MGLINQSEDSPRTPRISDVLFEKPDRSFGFLAALPSNVEAIEAGLLFSTGLLTHAVIVGPSGWGKSHLLDAVAFRFRREHGTSVDVVAAEDFVSVAGRGDGAGPLILDDCQEVLARTRQRLVLRVALERRVRAGRPTLMSFTMPRPTRQVRAFLPAGRDWTVATMAIPEPAERVLLVNQLAAAESLTLSPSLVRIVAFQMHGNGRTLAGAMKRLRLSGLSWLDARSTLRACGLLDPFFADNGGWDLKMRVLRAADAAKVQFSRVSVQDLAIYTMLKEASLSEADIARAVGLEPAEVYLRASRFEKECQRDAMAAAYVRQFVELIVAALASE